MELENESIIQKLEAIFMPQFQAGRDQLEKNGGEFVHYTSAENALNILSSRRLWFRNPTCMNDYMEISHGHKMLLTFFGNPNHRDNFAEALNSLHADLAKTVFESFDDWWAKIKYDTFIASVSAHSKEEDQHGRLSMWRAYGRESGKAALVLNNPPNKSKKLGVILSPALYFSFEELESMLLSIIKAIHNNIDYLKELQKETLMGTVVVSLIIIAVSLKHPGFREEREWRLIYLPRMMPENEWLHSSVETIDGVPQIIYKLPLENSVELEISGLDVQELLNKVIIGPTSYASAMYDAVCATLDNMKIYDIASKVVISGIPLRT